MRLGRKARKLTGERVELRRHRRENYSFYREWYGDGEVWRLTSWMAAPMEPAGVDRLFDEREMSMSDDSFAIHRIGERTPLGVISLMNISESNGSADLSVIIGPEEARSQGYGPEAIGLLLDYGFERLGLGRVGLSVFEFNEAAISAYERLGFRKEGRLRQAVERNGVLYDALLMSLLRSEWNGRNGTG
ncbi:GNAT family N-acetyltransferase [Rubrobacter aplysinae]|uniref:GNAT family N-acetyltransferase n=1 Tax=Rubrobacter aplysinae TaxID=909625 RepID=UPI001364B699|nr:GNAT family protein [Rubrobacter aplysinae]